MEEKVPENDEKKQPSPLTTDEADAWLLKFPGTKCQCCSNDGWIGAQDIKEQDIVGLVALDGVIVGEDGMLSKNNRGLVSFIMTCSTCGHIMLFNYNHVLDSVRNAKE